MTGVFLSYRGMHHSYAPMFAAWVLRQRFGDGLVFEASHDNEPGVQFADAIGRALDRCAVLVVFVNRHWRENRDLLADENDWVRREILHFLDARKPILPVLMDGEEMPPKRSLPAELAAFTRWIGLPLASASAAADLRRLVGRLEQIAADLVLAAVHEPVYEAATPAAWLRAEHEILPFRAPAELGEIEAWTRSSGGAPVRLVVGPPGAGKTRLARRLLATADRPAVLVPSSAEPAAMSRLSGVTSPFLVVIDDAESRPATVAAAVRALAAGRTPARLLLTARSGGDWWRDLLDDPDDRVAAMASRAETTSLTPLVPRPDDFRVAWTALADRLGAGGHAAPPVPPPAGALLEVQAAALATLDRGDGGGGTPWTRIAAIERARWRDTARARDLPALRPHHITEILAAVTVFGAATEPEARALIGGLRTFAGARPAEIDNALALVRVLLPGPLAVNPVEPKPLAGEVIAQHLATGDRLAGVLAGISEGQARTAVVALGQCLDRRSGLTEPVGELLAAGGGRLLRAAMTAPEPRLLLGAMTAALPLIRAEEIVDALPLRSTPLAEFAVELTRRAVRSRPEPRLHRLLAVRLVSWSGPSEEAVEEAEAALAGFPEPGAERAEAYATLALACRGPRALDAGRRAIEMFRQCADDDRTRGALATALVNQAHRDPADAAPAQEAYEILRDLDARNPARYRSLLADATDLIAVRTRSVPLAREALELRRLLAAARPDTYRVALGRTLHNLSVLVGADPEAAVLRREAEQILAAAPGAAG
ncbi:hypothetical protein Ade02nite_59580 [Paractinoplanes deccanensis]|uniref:TIR domain-containing protein n=1 Tax=Paractinoplanes deccanensis TaxID=113561 RepID=A0ABQ3YBD0_9ACTN|nr:toll/interleukin-1 receptor domain-containing protein [Actinoplanes deccanensis]GID77317.1 hypothetical protein Ade02nite_59580 [Actinoplanes deccanensis]